MEWSCIDDGVGFQGKKMKKFRHLRKVDRRRAKNYFYKHFL